VANTLKCFARDWLFATVEMLDWMADQLTWTNLKPRFQRQFATQTDEKMIIEGLSNLAMKPYESTGELLARINNTIVILKDSYARYENKPAAPAHHDINGGCTMDTATRWKNEAMNNAAQFLKMQLFRAALPADLQKVVAQRNPNTLTLDDMYQIATDTQRESGPKVKKTIAAVHPDERDNSDEDEEIAAFQKQKASKSTDRKKNSNPTRTTYKGPSSGSKSRSRPGNNTNICTPRTPMISGMPSIMNVDENNICNIVVENCAPYDVTLERDDILGSWKQKRTNWFCSWMILSHQYAKISITAFQK
jgi:hypothetical protein